LDEEVYYLENEYENSLSVRIDSISIDFISYGNKEVLEFLERDFGYFKFDNNKEPDICIEITNDVFEAPKNCTYFDNSIISFKNTIAIKYNARFREIWVAYSTQPYLGRNIKIYIPKKLMITDKKSSVKEKITRIFFPNFLYRWQNALMDIIHGPLLGLMHLRLLSGESAFLHASAISSENGKGIALPGWAQSGKSTIADILIKKNKWKFIAEDLCIVSKENTVYSFPKQRRVYSNQLKDTMYYKSRKNFLDKLQDRINIVILSAFNSTGVKAKRVLSWEEIYEENCISKTANLEAVVYLIRGDYEEISLSQVSGKKLAAMCSSMMSTEMRNFNGFYQLLDVYGVVSDDINPIQTLFKNTYAKYLSAFNDRKCYILRMPYQKNLKFVENWIHPQLVGILNDKK
jgi:hypothetical protein